MAGNRGSYQAPSDDKAECLRAVIHDFIGINILNSLTNDRALT